MATKNEALLFRIGADISDLQRKFQQAEKEVKGIAGAAQKAGKVMKGALALGAAVYASQAARQLFELGSAVEETADKFRVVMGPAIHEADAFVKSFANNAGLTTRELRDLYSNTVILAKGFGQGANEAAAFGEEVIRTAADMGSLFNRNTADVLERVNAALAGETEGLKTLVGAITQADVTTKALELSQKSVATELTRAERATATLALIQERAADSADNLNLTHDSAANTARRVSARFRELRDELASAVLPVFAQLFGALDGNNALFEHLRTLIDWTAKAAVVLVAVFQNAIVVAQQLANTFALVKNALRAMTDGTYSMRDAWDEYKTRETELAAQAQAILDGAKAAWASVDAKESLEEAENAVAAAVGAATQAAEAAVAAENKRKTAIENRLALMRQVTEIENRSTSNIVAEIRARGNAIRAAREQAAETQAAEEAMRAEFEKTAQAARDILARMADEDSARLRDNFVGAAEAIGEAFGDAGRAIGSLVGQLAEGNAVGFGLGLLTMGIGAMGKESASERRRREHEEAAAKRAKELADAIAELSRALSEELPIRRLVALGLQDELKARRQAQAHAEEFEEWINTNLMIPYQDVLVNQVFSGSAASDIFRAFESQNIGFLQGIADSLSTEFGTTENALRNLILQFIDMIEVQGLEAAALKAEQERGERAVELAEALRGFDYAARRAALAGDELGVAMAELERSHADQAAALYEQLVAGEISAAEYERFAELLQDEFVAGVEAARAAAEAAAQAEEALAIAREHAAYMATENLRVRLLQMQGVAREALLLQQKLELLEAVNEERGAEYMAILRQIHAEQLKQLAEREAAEAARKAAEAQREVERSTTRAAAATKEASRAIDGMSKVLNGPAGFTFAATRNAVLRAGGVPVGSAALGSGTSSSVVNIAPGAISVTTQPGQSEAVIAEQLLDGIAALIDGRLRAGGSNPLSFPNEGF